MREIDTWYSSLATVKRHSIFTGRINPKLKKLPVFTHPNHHRDPQALIRHVTPSDGVPPRNIPQISFNSPPDYRIEIPRTLGGFLELTLGYLAASVLPNCYTGRMATSIPRYTDEGPIYYKGKPQGI